MSNKNKFLKVEYTKLNASINGGRILEAKFTAKAGYKFTEIKTYLRRLQKESSKQLKENVDIVVSLYDKNSESSSLWRSSKAKHLKYLNHSYLDNELYTEDVDKLVNATFPTFRIYYLKHKKKQGGKSSHNDCLYNILKTNCSNFYSEKSFKSPSSFKVKLCRNSPLSYSRDMKIPYNFIPKIERLLKFKTAISITGIYESQVKSKIRIQLKLENEHYTIDDSNTDIIRNYPIKSHRRRGRTLCLSYFKRRKTGRYYNGKEWLTTYDKKKQAIQVCTDGIMKRLGCKNPEEFYKVLNTSYTKISKETFGEIDMFSHFSYASCAGYILNKYIGGIETEPLGPLEAEFVENASSSHLIYADIGYKGVGHSYDFKKFYTTILAGQFKIPCKKGEFKILDELPEKLETGIYRCKISKGETILPFNYHGENHYTDIHIKLARKLKLNVELIQDDFFNSLIYTEDKCYKGQEIFKGFLTKLLDLLELYKGDKAVSYVLKLILNSCWGMLCSKNQYTKLYEYHETYSVTPNHEIIGINIKGKKLEFEVVNPLKRYVTNYARLKPFILSQGRSVLTSMMISLGLTTENVAIINCDGFYAKNEIELYTPEDYKIKRGYGYLVDEGSIELNVQSFNNFKK